MTARIWRRSCTFIHQFHAGVTAGKDDSFSDNIYLRKVRIRCRQALDEYLPSIGMTDMRLLPLNEELLAMKYCHPDEELDGAICGMLSDLGLLHLAQAFTNDIAPHGIVEKGEVDKAKGTNPQEREGNGNAKETDDIASLKAEVESLKEQMKHLISQEDAARLIEEANKKTDEQQQQVADSMKADAARLIEEAKKKADEQQQQAADKMKAELAETVATADKKHEEAEAHLSGEIAALNTKISAQETQLEDLAAKIEKPAPKLLPPAPPVRTSLRLNMSNTTPKPLAPPARTPLRLSMRGSTQKRKTDGLDQAESTSSKRPATEPSKQASTTAASPLEAPSRLRWGRG
jgi:hypothetical protein